MSRIEPELFQGSLNANALVIGREKEKKKTKTSLIPFKPDSVTHYFNMPGGEKQKNI